MSNLPAHTPHTWTSISALRTELRPAVYSPMPIGEELVEEPLGYEGLQKDFSVANTQTFLDLMSENCRVAAAALEIKVKVAKVAQP